MLDLLDQQHLKNKLYVQLASSCLSTFYSSNLSDALHFISPPTEAPAPAPEAATDPIQQQQQQKVE